MYVKHPPFFRDKTFTFSEVSAGVYRASYTDAVVWPRNAEAPADLPCTGELLRMVPSVRRESQ